MPDFIIIGEKVILRKSPNHFQNTLLIGDSTSLPGSKLLIQPGRKCKYIEKTGLSDQFQKSGKNDHVL